MWLLCTKKLSRWCLRKQTPVSSDRHSRQTTWKDHLVAEAQDKEGWALLPAELLHARCVTQSKSRSLCSCFLLGEMMTMIMPILSRIVVFINLYFQEFLLPCRKNIANIAALWLRHHIINSKLTSALYKLHPCHAYSYNMLHQKTALTRKHCSDQSNKGEPERLAGNSISPGLPCRLLEYRILD